MPSKAAKTATEKPLPHRARPALPHIPTTDNEPGAVATLLKANRSLRTDPRAAALRPDAAPRDSTTRGFVETPEEIVDQMVERLFKGRHPKPTDYILDPGCGTGAFLRGIVRWCRQLMIKSPRLIGIESDPQRAKAARALLAETKQVEIREQDFLAESTEMFDFIIGNPPYVPITALSEAEKQFFRARYETARGRFDLYLLFFERALKSLKSDGRLVFITPEKFLYVETASPLRCLLSDFQIEELVLVDESAFGTLITYPTITTVVNRLPRRNTTIVRRDGSVTEARLNGAAKSWMPIISGIESSSSWLTLQDVCLRISCGVATGADSVFVRPAAELDPELIPFAYPTIAGRELSGSGSLPTGKYSMLIPYNRNGDLLPENRLGALGRYLSRSAIRSRLMARTCVRRKPWNAFHETPPLKDILRPKILCKDITQSARFWIDRSGSLVPRHSVYYIVPRHEAELDELCAYLNSRIAAEWLNAHCQRAANGFLRIQSNVIKQLPLPSHFATPAALAEHPQSAAKRSWDLAGATPSEAAR